MRVGFIGIGRMGRPMCRHLLDRGYALTVYDVNPEAVRPVVAAGAQAAASPRDVAAASDVTVMMVGFPEQAEAALMGSDGLLAGTRPGSHLIMGSTVTPGDVRRWADLAQKQGVGLLDAPVCRGEPAAESGNLLWLAGGEPEVLEACRPVLAACGPEIFYLGGVGSGQVAKAINNMILWACLITNHEGFRLGASYGLDPEALRQALLSSSARNWIMENWGIRRQIPWAHKDMRFVLDMAEEAGMSLPLAGLVRELVRQEQRRVAAGEE